jgi:Protein of unknown function (DUF3017)
MVRWEVPPSQRLAFVAVLAVTGLSILVTAFVDFRAGGYLLAGAVALAGTLRALLPPRYCLGLLVRTRRMDVAVAAVLAIAVALAAAVVPR